MANFKREIPYNDLPLMPPQADIETKNVLKKVISAGRALAQLNGALQNIPNPTLFLDAIYVQESKASSEVENIVTTNDALYQSMVGIKKIEDAATKEVLRYKEALWLGFEHIDKKPFITTNLCISIVQCIKQNTAGIRNTPGTKLANDKGEVIYTPPEGEAVIIEKLKNWETFVNNADALDPLIKMALMHYQFEAIHPFSDGNGRTGRILLLLYLKLSGLLTNPAIFLSEYIIQNKAAYYERLRGVTENNAWEPFILYMLDMVEVTSLNGINRINKITELMHAYDAAIKLKLPKVYSRELIDILFKLPYTKRQHLIDAQLGNPKTVGNYLMALEEEGFLHAIKVGKEKLYLNKPLLSILEGR